MGTLILHELFTFVDEGDVELDEVVDDDEEDDDVDEEVDDLDDEVDGVLFRVVPDTSSELLSDTVSLLIEWWCCGSLPDVFASRKLFELDVVLRELVVFRR